MISISKPFFGLSFFHQFTKICTETATIFYIHVSKSLTVKFMKNVNMKKHFTQSKCTCQAYWEEYLKVSSCVVASILYKNFFLHFYSYIDYTFNVVRNECIQMERSEFVWIFELRQIMQPNCSYYSRKSFIMISFGWNHRYITSTYILYDCYNNLF